MALTVGTNSYIDVATAEAYFADRLFADAWNNATATQKPQALIMATKAIDRQMLIGAKKTDEQTLEFPRRYQYQIHDIWRKWFQDNIYDDFETLYVEGASLWAEADVPQQVKDAVCEEALERLARGGDSRTKLQRAGVTSAQVTGVMETYAPGSATRLLSIEAKELLQPWLAGSVKIT